MTRKPAKRHTPSQKPNFPPELTLTMDVTGIALLNYNLGSMHPPSRVYHVGAPGTWGGMGADSVQATRWGCQLRMLCVFPKPLSAVGFPGGRPRSRAHLPHFMAEGDSEPLIPCDQASVHGIN